MAELGFIINRQSTGGGGGSSTANAAYRSLYRTAGNLAADTPISFNTPGAGWVSAGQTITFSGASNFTQTTQIFRNGQLQLLGENDSADNDIYYVSDSSFACEFPVNHNDVFQIWQFTTASGS